METERTHGATGGNDGSDHVTESAESQTVDASAVVEKCLCVACGVFYDCSVEHTCETVSETTQEEQNAVKDSLGARTPTAEKAETHSAESPEKTRVCTVCNKGVSKKNFAKHRDVHNDTKRFRCNRCNHFFRRSDHFKRHLKLHSKRDNKSQRKTKWTNVKPVGKRMINDAGQRKTLLDCASCNDLNGRKVKKSSARTPFVCQRKRCFRRFESKEDLTKHTNSHIKRNEKLKELKKQKNDWLKEWRNKECPTCKVKGCKVHEHAFYHIHAQKLAKVRRFISRRENADSSCLRTVKPKKSNPVKLTAKPRKCLTCAEFCCSDQCLADHDPIHVKDHRFKCDVCGKRFKWIRDYESHSATHKKDVVCRNCGRKYKNRGSSILKCTSCRLYLT